MNLSVQNLSVSFGKHAVLTGLNLELNRVGTLTLLGSSGTGKSTFLRLLSGLTKKHGQIIGGFIELEGMCPTEFMNTGEIGFMFQEPSLLPHLTVEENIRLPLRLRRTDLAYAEHLIDRVGLGDFRHLLPRQLSGGMKTRVALARTLAPRPRFLLLDEPFSALDVAWRFRLYRELTTLQGEIPMITILVTHDIQEALLLSNRVLVLGRSGKIVQNLEIQDPLPRIFRKDPLEKLQSEFQQLQNFFINEEEPYLS